MNTSKVIVLVSGGLDSTVLLWRLKTLPDTEVRALSIYYGQRHARELIAAEEICRVASVKREIIDLAAIQPFLKGSSQTDDIAVPSGHYEDPSMRVTVVPNRNMMMLSVAAAYAIGHGFGAVAFAAHSGDHAIYPDCRLEFAMAMDKALQLCHYDGGVSLLYPFVALSKTEIVNLGMTLHAPLGMTWSCYSPRPDLRKFPDRHGMIHCGICGTCQERREAFQRSNLPDPTFYAETPSLASKSA